MRGLFFICLLGLFVGCSSEHKANTRIFCAASLGDFIKEYLDDSYDSQIGGSLTLVNQIKAGASADILLLADATLGSRLDQETIERQAVLASNRLVLIRPSDFESIESQPTVALADPNTAPLGRYSKALLQKRPIQGRVTYLKDAKAVLGHVALAHSDLGIVYYSDAYNDERVEIIREFETNLYPRIQYQLILFKSANKDAKLLFDRLLSEEVQSSLAQLGLVRNSE